MNDRDPEEPNLEVPHGASQPGSSGESEAGDSDDGRGRAHGEFQQGDFSEAYERYPTERLQDRSKQELVRDYLDLERRLSQAEEETRRLQQLRGDPGRLPCLQVEELAAEVQRLRTENQRLREENAMWNRKGSCPDGEPGTYWGPPTQVTPRRKSRFIHTQAAGSQGGRRQMETTPSLVH